MPDTTWPINGHPPDSSRDRFDTPVSMSPVSLSTRLQRFAYARLPDPHLTRHARLFHIAHHSRVTAPAACGGLKPPPAGRLRRANNPSSPAQHHFRKHCLHRTLPSAFRTHRNDDHRRHGDLRIRPNRPGLRQPHKHRLNSCRTESGHPGDRVSCAATRGRGEAHPRRQGRGSGTTGSCAQTACPAELVRVTSAQQITERRHDKEIRGQGVA